MGLLALTQLAALMTWNVADWLPHHIVPSPESPLLDNSHPDGDSLAIVGLTMVDDDLPLTTVIGLIALVHVCLWPTRYLERPRLLTRT